MSWKPTQKQINESHLGQWMTEKGMSQVSEIYQWSITDRLQFWQEAMGKVGIRFKKYYEAVADFSEDSNVPRWLPGAEFNIIDSCFPESSDLSSKEWAKPALIFPEKRYLGAEDIATMSYKDLYQMASQVANGLINRGMIPGSRIAIDMPMHAESVAIYLGIVMAGCVVVGIADSFSAPEIDTRLEITKPVLLFTQDVIPREGEELALYGKILSIEDTSDVEPGVSCLPQMVVLSRGTRPVALRHHDCHFHDFLSENNEFQSIARTSMDELNVLFSSGTTGEPKAIPWNHTTPIKCAVDGWAHFDMRSGDTVAWPTSLGWMMGPWLIFATLINRGTIALYPDSPSKPDFGRFVQDAKVSILGLVPTLVRLWKSSESMNGFDWSAVRCFGSTGESSNETDMLWLMETRTDGTPVIEYCGGTEIGGAYITGSLAQEAIPGTFSMPALGSAFVLLNEKGNEATKGEVFIQGPSMGYSDRLVNKDHFSVYFGGTPLDGAGNPLRRHGDQIEKLDNGYYRAHGRVDNTMNLGGVKTSSVEIETVINKISEVRESAAVGISSESGGPARLVIFAVINGIKNDDEKNHGLSDRLKKEMQARIKDELNPLFKIHDVVMVHHLPRTASNKVVHRDLRQQYHASFG